MNRHKAEKVVFTDNLSLFYKNYIGQAQSNPKSEAAFLKDRIEKFMNKINELRTQLYLNKNVPTAEQDLLTSWSQAFSLYFKINDEVKHQDLDGGGPMTASRKVIMTEDWLLDKLHREQDNQSEAFKVINYLGYYYIPFFENMSSSWDIRFAPLLQEQIATLSDEEILVLMCYVSLIKRGILFLHKFIGQTPQNFNWVLDPEICYSLIFCEAFNETQVIVGAVMPERIPSCPSTENALGSLYYRQYIVLTELADIDRIMTLRKDYDGHKAHLKHDPDLFKCFHYDQVNLRKDAPKNELYIAVQHKQLFTGDVLSYSIKPLKICKWMLKEPSAKGFRFNKDSRRWEQFQFEEKPRQVIEIAQFADQDILNQLETEKQTQKLAQLLDLMPNLKIKLSDLQQSVVKSNQNLLCLGRSGTGKTTTSVLRLFAQEILYTILNKQKALNQEYQLQLRHAGDMHVQKPDLGKVSLEAADLVKPTGTKIVFITASPVLTNEVMRFYNNIKSSLKVHLQNREAKRKLKLEAQAKKEAFEEVKDSDAEIELLDDEEQQPEQLESVEDQEKRELLEFIQKEEKLILDDAQLEGQMQIPNSYSQLQPHHFPLFVTVKRLIYMMDACLNFSFFSRDNQNRIIGLDSNLGWHNESKGVMMINHYYKENIDYDEQLTKFGKEILEMDNDVEINQDEDDTNQGNNFYISDEQQKRSQSSAQTEYKYQYVFGQNRVNEKYILERQQLSFEVDYDVFEGRFWPKISQRRNLRRFSPTLIWTEIYSVIKGGMKSNSYYMGYLPKNAYINKEASEFLTIHEKRAVYYIFLEYEKWKQTMNAYDFMDLVAHVQKRLWYGESLRRMKMDFLMVDEVQDLTPKTVQLLLQLTNHNVFFAGDTAQTIAKGVGARFLDLRHIFTNVDYEVPKIVQLTKNYRSHGRILDVANSVVDLIELFFPKTIDKLQKEESELNGMVPLVIMPLDSNSMRTLFMGANVYSGVSGENLAAPQFGCNQVLIVRDQAAKALVPDIFKNMLCLSVYEAKGLEFDDVILYNFFHLGDVSKGQWKLLNDIVYDSVKKVKYGEEILQLREFDTLDVEKFEQLMKQIKEKEKMAENEDDYEEEIQLRVARSRDEVYRKFSMLCIELKFLYVAITRPKRRLIIYDDVSDGRKPLQNYWEKLGIVDVVTKEMAQSPETLKEDIKQLFQAGALNKDRSTEEEWRLQGIKLFKKKYYDAAIKCFTFAGDHDLAKRCMAYREADEGTNKQSEADSSTWRAKTLKYLSKPDKKKLLKEAKRIRAQASTHFASAGALFEQIKMLKHAASCFYTAKDYNKAAEIFENLGQFGQAAECLMIENQLLKAAKLYEKANLVTLAIECYENAGEWESLLHCLHRNKEFFKAEERESLVNKYVPVALNSLYKLYSEMDEENQLDEENKGKMHEMKIKLKYQKKVNVIHEEANEEDSLSSENESVKEQEEGEEEKGEEEQEEEVEIIDTDVQEKKEGDAEGEEEEIDILDEVFQIKKHRQQKEEEQQLLQAQKDETKINKTQELSFEVIGNDGQVENPDQQEVLDDLETDQPRFEMKDDFEHLSQYDPDDEFLRSSKSVSIIESILSKRSISHTSEFSIITSKQGGKDSKLSNNIAYVESNRDIYAEDVITQKIIYYVSLFSGEVSERLSKLRSKNVLFSKKEGEDKAAAALDEQEFLIDLDDVDNDFINLILDALEYYELFRLCLMVCNRYHMSERLGRYLVSVCSKYSNLHNHRFNIEQVKCSYFNSIWKEKQRQSSILAHEAIHNVFSLINPKFLSLKDYHDSKLTKENSLGMETYRMMMELGFWKKLVYIISGKASLELCVKFIDRTNFEYLQSLLSLDQSADKDQVQQWHDQLVFTHHQQNVLGRIQEIEYIENCEKTFKELVQVCNETESDYKDVLTKCLKLSEWLFKPHQVTPKKAGSVDEQKKLDKQYDQQYYQNEKVLNILQSECFASNDFKSHFFAFQLALVPQTKFYSKLLYNVKEFFDVNSIKQLVNIYLKTLRTLNMECQPTPKALEALYAVFLVSPLDSQTGEDLKANHFSCSEVFKQYKDTHCLVNRNSILLNDIMIIQRSINNKVSNEILAQKMQELKPRYFRVQNFKQAVINYFADFENNNKQRKALMMEKNEMAFILDMDASFLMVPKTWITKLLSLRLINLSLSLSNELKTKMKLERFDQRVSNMEGSSAYVHRSLEAEIEQVGIEIQTMERVNRQLKSTVELHEKYVKALQQDQDKLKLDLNSKPDFQDLVVKYWKNFNLSLISFQGVKQSISSMSRYPLSFIKHKFQMTFDMGVLHEKHKVLGINEILPEAFLIFKQAFDSTQSIKDQFPMEEVDVKRYRLQKLLTSLQYFILIDKYEYLIEVIKKKKSQLKSKVPKSASTEDTLWVLTKFMIAIDIHVYLKCGSFSLAADSMFQFLNTFYPHLNYEEKVQLSQNAFYLLSIAKFGKFYAPDYALTFLDIGYDLDTYYSFENQEQSLNLQKQVSYQGDERILIEIEIKGKNIEKVEKDSFYNEALYWVNKILTDLNADEVGSAHKKQYKRLYNILMTASLNDAKKSSKTIEQIQKGFELIASSSFDEYFLQKVGLQDIDYTSAKGLNQLSREFQETQNEYKWEFFVGSKKSYGQFMTHIDATQSQTKEAQASISKTLEKAFFQEQKNLASHLYLSMKLKALFKAKVQLFKQKTKVKQNSYETRQFVQALGLSELLLIEQMPAQQILEKIKQSMFKQMVLKQLIVSKYASSSQDLHFILLKANELEDETLSFISFIQNYIQEKGAILKEFITVNEDNENGIPEVVERLQATARKFYSLNQEMTLWMEKMAEPNLVEVERKSKKYKLKWESLNIFEKRQKIAALRKKMEIIQQK